MNVQTITAPAAEARLKATAYRERLRRMGPQRAEREEYSRCAELLEALGEGKTLVDVAAAIASAPVDAQGRPRLAIARADRRQVEIRVSRDGCRFDACSTMGRQYSSLIERFDRPARDASWQLGYALVPLVPADVRPATGQLRDWHVLWEVEQWSDRRLGARPDVDPYLLRRVVGDVFEVLAEWDLTEVERMVMAARVRG